MGLFNLFKKKKDASTEEKPEKNAILTEDNLKWDKMWDLWVDGAAASPYAELMTYQGEINNGGHDQYFTNVENTGDLRKEMAALEQILSSKLKNNLAKAHKAYLVLEEKEDDTDAKEILERCDAVFYQNEQEINEILKEYASTIVL